MDQVEEIKQKIDIVELVSGYVTLKQAGRNFKGLCPFHQEKTPSFMVNPELGIYRCFGCGKGGDIYSFLEDIEGLSFPEALEQLAERAGIQLERHQSDDRGELDLMRQAHDLALQYYHYLLTKHEVGKVALDYLKKRGIGLKLVDQFELGFAPESWDGLATYLVEKKGFKQELLERAGLLVRSSKGSFYDRFRARVIFPLFDHRGKVIGFAGRVIPGMSREDEPKYINSPETPLYHKSQVLYGLNLAKKAIRDHDRAVLVEGELDMISSFAAGVSETVAIKGTALTEDQIRLLGRYSKHLILALDADVAGDTAAKRGVGLAEAAGLDLKMIHIKGGKDPDDIARQNPKGWQKMVEEAIDIYEYYLTIALERYDPKTVEGKRQITKEVLPVVNKIANEVIKAHYVRRLSNLLEVGEESVLAELTRIGKTELLPTTREVPKESQGRLEMLGRELLRLLWATGSEAIELSQKKLAGLELEKAIGQIVSRWFEFKSSKTGEEKVITFVKSLPPELKDLAGEVYLEPVDTTRTDRDLETVLADLVQVLIKAKLDQISQRLKMAENEKDKETSKKMQSLFVQWSKRLT